jgi:hypothetical protein
LDQGQIKRIKEIVTPHKQLLGETLKSHGFEQEDVEHTNVDSDDDSSVNVMLKHDKKIALLKLELAALEEEMEPE